MRCVALSRAVAGVNAGTVCTRPITSKAKSTPSLRLLWRHTPRERGHFVRQCLKEILLKTGGQNVRAPVRCQSGASDVHALRCALKSGRWDEC